MQIDQIKSIFANRIKSYLLFNVIFKIHLTMGALLFTDIKLPYLTERYTGKVRDVYTIAFKYLVMVCTDWISAFDRVFREGIPLKGNVIN